MQRASDSGGLRNDISVEAVSTESKRPNQWLCLKELVLLFFGSWTGVSSLPAEVDSGKTALPANVMSL